MVGVDVRQLDPSAAAVVRLHLGQLLEGHLSVGGGGQLDTSHPGNTPQGPGGLLDQGPQQATRDSFESE